MVVVFFLKREGTGQGRRKGNRKYRIQKQGEHQNTDSFAPLLTTGNDVHSHQFLLGRPQREVGLEGLLLQVELHRPLALMQAGGAALQNAVVLEPVWIMPHGQLVLNLFSHIRKIEAVRLRVRVRVV